MGINGGKERWRLSFKELNNGGIGKVDLSIFKDGEL
jgi:hypothetical protein